MSTLNTYCSNCNHPLRDDWIFCTKCSKSRYPATLMICPQCKHAIIENNPIYCPYCRFDFLQIDPIRPESLDQSDAVVKKTVPTPNYEIFKTSKITRHDIVNNLKFDTFAMTKIMSSKYFTPIAVVLLIFSALTFAIGSQFVDRAISLFSSPSFNTQDPFLSRIFLFFIFMVSFALIYTFILTILDVKDKNHNFIRILGSYAPIFMGKDIILILLTFYVTIVSSKEQVFILLQINDLLINLSLIYAFIHLIFTTKHLTKLGTSMTIILILLTFFIVILFPFYYFDRLWYYFSI